MLLLINILVSGITLLFRAGSVQQPLAQANLQEPEPADQPWGPGSRVAAPATAGPATRLPDHGLRGSHRR